VGKDPRDLVDQIDNPGDISGNTTTEGETPERALGKGTPSELPEDDLNPFVVNVPDPMDKRADIDPESSLATSSDKTPVIVSPATKKPEGGVPAEAHPTFGSVKRSNDILSPCGPDELGSTENTCPTSGDSATAADAEGVEKIDLEPSGLGDPGSSILIPQVESSENASDGSLPSGARVALGPPAVDVCVALADETNAERKAHQGLDATEDIPNLEQPVIDVCVTSPDEPNAERISEDAHQESDATKDIPNKREFESIADSPGKTELSPHGSKSTGVGSVGSPRLLDGEGGADMAPEPLGRASASPRPLDDPHIPRAPEGTGAGGGGGSGHDFGTAPRILEKLSPLLESSRDSDVSDSSYTSDISDISDAKVGKDTNTLGGTDPIINPEADSEYLEKASTSLDIDILGALKDDGAARDVDPIDGPKNCSEPPEKNIGSFESPPNPAQDSDPLEAASDAEPSQENDQVNSLGVDSGSLLDEGPQPIQPTDSNSLEPVDGSGSIEELDIISPNTATDPESQEGVNAPQARSVGIGAPEALGNSEHTAGASDPEGGSKPSEEASTALGPFQPLDVSKVAQAADSAQQINKTDTLQDGPDPPKEIVPAAVPLQDSIAPVVENVARSGAPVLVDGATDVTSISGAPPLEDTVSTKLPSSPATENTSQDAAPEGGSVLKDIESLGIVGLEGAEDVFVDIEEEFGIPGAHRGEETKDSDSDNLPAVELLTGGAPLFGLPGLTTGDGQGISSNDSTGLSITAEGLENIPRTPSTASIATSFRKGDSGESPDTCSDASENNLGSTEITESLGARDKTTLSEPLDTPHSHQVDPLKSPKITTPGQSTSPKIDGNFDPSGIVCKKEESTRPQLHVVAAKLDADPQRGTQEADEADPQKMEVESAKYFTAAVLPPTPQPDWHVPECSKCRQATVLGRLGQGPNEYAPAGNPESLEQEGSPRSKVNRTLSTPGQVINADFGRLIFSPREGCLSQVRFPMSRRFGGNLRLQPPPQRPRKLVIRKYTKLGILSLLHRGQPL